MIALLTDFGTADLYVGVMKCVIAAIAPQAVVIDLTHDVPPQNIAVGALQIEAAWQYLPPGATLVGVVDPGVGGARRPIAAEIDGKRFVGPDNGPISRVGRSRSSIKVVTLTRAEYLRPTRRGETFHGRDVFAPAAAHLELWAPLDELGSALSQSELVALPGPVDRNARADGRIAAAVALTDRFGDIILDLPAGEFEAWRAGAARFTVHCAGGSTGSPAASLAASYSNGGAEPLLLVPNSYGLIEIAKQNGSAVDALPLLRIGDIVELERSERGR